MGKPEPLKNEFSGFWSRRIDEKNRIVYRIKESNIEIVQCKGYDSLFFKYSEAPVTVLAVKDRILAHNPLGAVYLSESAYRKKLFPSKD